MADNSLDISVFGGGTSGDPTTSLVDLARSAKPPAAPAPAPIRGDDAITNARNLAKPSPEEARLASLYTQSEQIIQGEIQSNPKLGEELGAKIDALTKAGKLQDVSGLIIDEADKVKIRELQKENPSWFTSKDAASAGFLNEATFGQLTKVIGGLATIRGQNYEDVVAQKAEQFRLLSKAFPGWSTVGKVASYLTPGSPARALFEGAASLGSKAVMTAATASLFKKVATDPGFLTKVAASAAAGAFGAGAVEGTKGTLGTDLQELNLDRGAGEAAQAFAVGGLAGGSIPVITEAGSQVVGALSKPISRMARNMSDSVAKQVQDLSGTPKEALRAFNRDPEAMRAAAGKDFVRSEKLKNFIEAVDDSRLPERQAADGVLVNFKDVDAKKLVDFLKSAHGGNDPQVAGQANIVRQWGDNFANKFAKAADETVAVNPNSLTPIESKVVPGAVDSRVSAPQLRQWVDEMQAAASKFYGKDAPFAAEKIKEAAAMGRQMLLDAAKTEGANGVAYTQNMAKAAEKRDVVGFLMDRMGKSDVSREMRAKGFYKSIFGTNNTAIELRLRDLDQKFGTTFWDEAKQSFFSRQLGDKGAPALLPQQQTGKSLLGIVLGGVTKGPVGAVTGGLASSPRVGAAAIGVSDTVSGFVRQMLAKPEVLARLAGRAEAGGNSAAVAQLRVPEEVRKIAQSLSSTLTKDGPISAASTTRLIADTPYFVGLVHYFDVADRQAQKKGTVNAIQRNAYENNPNIAAPR